jgi:hypothetical protein
MFASPKHNRGRRKPEPRVGTQNQQNNKQNEKASKENHPQDRQDCKPV